MREGYSRMHLTNQGLTAGTSKWKSGRCPLPPTKRDSDLQGGKLKETRREAGQFKLVLDTFLSRPLRVARNVDALLRNFVIYSPATYLVINFRFTMQLLW